METIMTIYDEYIKKSIIESYQMADYCESIDVPLYLEYSEFIDYCKENDIDLSDETSKYRKYLDWVAKDSSIVDFFEFNYNYYDHPSTGGLGIRIEVKLESIDIEDLFEKYIIHCPPCKVNYDYCEDRCYYFSVEFVLPNDSTIVIDLDDDDSTCAGHYYFVTIYEIIKS